MGIGTARSTAPRRLPRARAESALQQTRRGGLRVAEGHRATQEAPAPRHHPRELVFLLRTTRVQLDPGAECAGGHCMTGAAGPRAVPPGPAGGTRCDRGRPNSISDANDVLREGFTCLRRQSFSDLLPLPFPQTSPHQRRFAPLSRQRKSRMTARSERCADLFPSGPAARTAPRHPRGAATASRRGPIGRARHPSPQNTS